MDVPFHQCSGNARLTPPDDYDIGDAAFARVPYAHGDAYLPVRRRDSETQRRRDTGGHRDTSLPGDCVSVSPVSPLPGGDVCVTPDDDYLASVMASVRVHSLPPAAGAYHLPGIRLLVGLCAELQRLAGDRPFFLGCRDAGRVLDGVPFQRAAKWLRRLCVDGIIIRLTRGAQTTGEASTYRYVGDQAHMPTSTRSIVPPGDLGAGPYGGERY